MTVRTSSIVGADIRTEYLQAGIGGRPLLLVHGFTGAKEDFTEVMDDLADRGWWAIAPDLRGHGRSDHPPHPDHYSLVDFADDLLDLLDEIGITEFTLLGHSMGGVVAQLIALAEPDRLDGLILMDTLHGPVPEVGEEAVRRTVGIVATGGIDFMIELNRGREGHGDLDTPAHRRLLADRPGYAEFCERKLRNSSAAMYTAIYPELVLGQADRLDALEDLDVPTLVVCGEEDVLLPHSQALAAAIPDARFAVIPDAGHSPQFENPSGWRAALFAFLDDLVLAAGD